MFSSRLSAHTKRVLSVGAAVLAVAIVLGVLLGGCSTKKDIFSDPNFYPKLKETIESE